MKNNENSKNELVVEEVELNDPNIMEETLTPALGGVCGLGWGGAICGFWC